MPETTIEVLRRRDLPSTDPARVGRLDRLTAYRVDGDIAQVRFVTLPLEGWSERAEQDAITKAELDRRVSTPRRFTIKS